MGKVTMYMAVSADGFIADENDKTPWSDEEWELFKNFVRSQDAIIMGSNTCRIMEDGDEFVEGPKYYVASRKKSSFVKAETLNISEPEDLPSHAKVGVIGGGDLNGQLVNMGLVNEIILDIEPITLGQGKRLFGDHKVEIKLGLMESKAYGANGRQHRYSIKG